LWGSGTLGNYLLYILFKEYYKLNISINLGYVYSKNPRENADMSNEKG